MTQLRLAVSKCRGGAELSKNSGPNFPLVGGLQHARRVMPSHATSKAINAALLKRFGAEFEIDPELNGLDELEKIAGHRSHRRYLPRPIEPDLLRLLCACALSAPSKSDLQQCDIIIVSDATIRKSIVSLIREMPWINDAPVFLVCAANAGVCRRFPSSVANRFRTITSIYSSMRSSMPQSRSRHLSAPRRQSGSAAVQSAPSAIIRES